MAAEKNQCRGSCRLVLATSRPVTVTERWHTALLPLSHAGAPCRLTEKGQDHIQEILIPPGKVTPPPNASAPTSKLQSFLSQQLHPGLWVIYMLAFFSGDPQTPGVSCCFGSPPPSSPAHTCRPSCPRWLTSPTSSNDLGQHQMEHPKDPYFYQAVFKNLGFSLFL